MSPLALWVLVPLRNLGRARERLSDALASVSLRGRLVGKQKYFLACWARHVTRREKK